MQHDYELYLALNDIEHTKTKVRHPQTNGICERFHKTILNEFYQITFRKKIYTTLDELQKDLFPLNSFILPGGGKVSGFLHQARTVCRRAEREILRLSREEEVSEWAGGGCSDSSQTQRPLARVSGSLTRRLDGDRDGSLG